MDQRTAEQVEAARAEVRALRADRRRLLWLIEEGHVSALRRYDDGEWTMESEPMGAHGHSWREAVDNAMTQEGA